MTANLLSHLKHKTKTTEISMASLLIGANSAIALALASELEGTQVYRVSRRPLDPLPHCRDFICDNQDHEIRDICSQIDITQFDKIVILNGVLHDEKCQPEKSLSQLESDSFLHIIQSNTLTPVLWLKSLMPLFSPNQSCHIAVLSARVGSIQDNHLGGWYSYRASKAALNMLLQSCSVELGRRARNIKLLAFHPGTTDTPLSKPFQSKVPNLLTPDYVAQQLLRLLPEQQADQRLSFIDWQGKSIPW